MSESWETRLAIRHQLFDACLGLADVQRGSMFDILKQKPIKTCFLRGSKMTFWRLVSPQK